MRLEARKYLFDLREAANRIVSFTAGVTFEGYSSNEMLRSAVERQFAIIGEALTQLARLDESLASQITEFRRIIAFRNLLIHGYADVDNRLVWDIVETRLATLQREITGLLEMPEG